MRFYFIFYLFIHFLGLKLCEMARPGGSRPMPNLACFNIAIFSIISALSVGPAVKFLPCLDITDFWKRLSSLVLKHLASWHGMFLNRWSGWTGFLLVVFFACWAF